MYKILLVIILLIIIILLPLAMSLLYNHTIIKNRWQQLITLAKQTAINTKKSLIVFNDQNNGIVYDPQTNINQKFDGNLIDIVSNMRNNSCVLLVREILEYIPNPVEIINEFKRISGGDLYLMNIDSKSFQPLWDYKLRFTFNDAYYTPQNSDMKVIKFTALQNKSHQIYKFVLKFIPYKFFVYAQP